MQGEQNRDDGVAAKNAHGVISTGYRTTRSAARRFHLPRALTFRAATHEAPGHEGCVGCYEELDGGLHAELVGHGSKNSILTEVTDRGAWLDAALRVLSWRSEE